MRRLVFALAAAAMLALAPPATAQDQQQQDATLYCQGDGGPLGMASDAEHSVLLGEEPLPPGVRSSRISVNGATTRVLEAGPASAQTAVVFIHGNPGTSRDWDDLLSASGGFARAVAIDVSGYGQSDKAAAQVQSTNGAADYIQGALEQIGIRHAVLVLHDFGGIWGLQWAVKHPDALHAAVLIDAGVLIDYIPHPFALVWATPIAGELQMATTTRQSFLGPLQAQNPRPFPPGYLDRMYDNYDRATRCAALRYYRSASQNLNIGREHAAVLSKRKRPALVIWGEQDIFIPPEHAEKQRQAFPDARVELFEDSGHWPHIDNADRARGLFVPFLKPRLRVGDGGFARGRVRIRARASGVLPAQEVRMTVHRDGRLVGRSAPVELSGARTLSLRPRRGLRAGRYRISVGARGLPTRTRVLHLGFPERPRPGRGNADPRFSG